MKKSSGFLSTNTGERIKGLILVVVGTIFTAIYEIVKSGGTIPTDRTQWGEILLKGVSVGMLYISVTFFGNGKPTLLERKISSKE